MPQFRYQALNAEQQRVAGVITADGLAHALALLEARQLRVLSIADEESLPPDSPVELEEPGQSPFVTAQQQVEQRRQLEQLLAQARVLLPPLRAFAAEMPARKRQQLQCVTEIIAAGDADQAQRTLRVLPGFWIPLLGSAAATRNPGKVLREFIAESQRADQLLRQWTQAIAYPLLLLGVTSGVFVTMSFLFIPVFREIFTGFGIRVPALTQFVLSLAEWITSGRLFLVSLGVLLAIFVLVVAFRVLIPRVWEWCEDRFSLWRAHSTFVARFAQFAADLFEAGLEPTQALRLAGEATGSRPIARAAQRLSAAVSGGPELSPGLNSRLLTTTVKYALLEPHPPETRIRLLRELSNNHFERMATRLSWTRGLIEPLAILAVGLIVGITVLALFMPLFQLVSALS